MIRGTIIFDLLTAANITAFPIIADSGANTPFAVYRRNNFDISSKDGSILITYEVKFVANSYASSLEMLNSFLNVAKGFEIEDFGEEFNDNYYINTIQITIENEYNV